MNIRKAKHGFRTIGSRGFSLIETVFSMVIVLLVGLAVVGSIIYSRQSMELDKQRTAAINFCRSAMEEAETMANVTAGLKQLVPFNSPGIEIDAYVNVGFYDINSDGTIKWGTPLASRPPERPVFCQATVSWIPTGSWSNRLRSSGGSVISTTSETVAMSTIVRAGSI